MDEELLAGGTLADADEEVEMVMLLAFVYGVEEERVIVAGVAVVAEMTVCVAVLTTWMMAGAYTVSVVALATSVLTLKTVVVVTTVVGCASSSVTTLV